MLATGERKSQNKLENHEIDAILSVMEEWCDRVEQNAGIAPKRRNWGQIIRRTALTACCVYVMLDMAIGNPIRALEHRPALVATSCP